MLAIIAAVEEYSVAAFGIGRAQECAIANKVAAIAPAIQVEWIGKGGKTVQVKS